MPHPTRLGSGEWQRAKARVKTAVQVLARELLALYAAREVLPGHAFPPDTAWQMELEAVFPYVETPDQLAAITAVKQDMEAPRPMDRPDLRRRRLRQDRSRHPRRRSRP